MKSASFKGLRGLASKFGGFRSGAPSAEALRSWRDGLWILVQQPALALDRENAAEGRALLADRRPIEKAFNVFRHKPEMA